MRKESEIQRAICEYLYAKGYMFTRVNNIPVFDPRSRRYRAMPKYTLKGFPDILVLKDGNTIGIEVKSETGKLSQDQKDFKEMWEKNGGAYIVARSIGDVYEAGL